MTQSQIRENLFQKQHAEAMQALIWALALLKQKARNHQALTEQEKTKLNNLKLKHAAAIKEEPELAGIFNDLVNNRVSIDKKIRYLTLREKRKLEELERQSSRNKLSVFFAFFMALGCGTTIAGSNFLMGAEHGWIMNIGFLSTLVIVSFPIILAVTIANWWLGIRAVTDLENKNKEPFKLVEQVLGKYNRWKWPFFALGIFLIELYNGIGLNLKNDKQPPKFKVNALLRGVMYFTVILGALIYAFFAFAATYNLGMGIYDLLVVKNLAGASGFTAAAGVSAAFGILMAIPTYITMKIVYYVCGKSMMIEGEGPLDVIDSIPGITPTLRKLFMVAAVLIVASVAFMTYAAVGPLAQWFVLAGMSGSIASPLALGAIIVAFLGNVPFFLLSAAKSFKQIFDPREQLKQPASKWFPYIRFWNAVLNAIPVAVGILAFAGLCALPGPWSIFLPVVLNFIVSPAGGIASYFANSNGSPDMYQFDPAKQISKFQLAVLEKLENNQSITIEYDQMTADQQLQAEFHGAKVYLREEDQQAQMPVLAQALYRAVTHTDDLSAIEQAELYQALTNPPRNLFTRALSFMFHGNVRYTQNLFSYDYLHRIEYYASKDIKNNLYSNALIGGGQTTAVYQSLLRAVPIAQDYAIQDLVLGVNADLFWKAYSVKSHGEQTKIINVIRDDYRAKPEVQELLMQHSSPEVRKTLMSSQISAYQSSHAYQHFYDKNSLEMNVVTGFLGKNLAFPVVLMWSGLTSLFKAVARRIPAFASWAAKPLDAYEYYTELADTPTRLQYLVDVLQGYIETSPEDIETATRLKNILAGDKAQCFINADFLALGTGIVGRVFTLAGRIPEVKSLLEKALDGAKVIVENNESEIEMAPSTGSEFPLFFSSSHKNTQVNTTDFPPITLTPIAASRTLA